jgi:hypothetical protein
MSDKATKIYWTLTDEAPALATYALLPIVNRMCKPASVAVEPADISVAARILSAFPVRVRPFPVGSRARRALRRPPRAPAPTLFPAGPPRA